MAQSNETFLIIRSNFAIWWTPIVTYDSDHVHVDVRNILQFIWGGN